MRWLSHTLLLALLAMALAPAPAPAAEGAAEEAAAEKPSGLQKLPPELRRVMEELQAANADLRTCSARIVYERSIPLLEDTQTSRGRLLFQKPDHIALKLGEPRNEEVYCNGELWWVVSHEEREVQIYRAAGSAEEATSEAAFLDFGYGRPPEELLAEYEIELTEKIPPQEDGRPTIYRVKLTPRQDTERPARYAAIEVELADDQWLPRELVLHESGGEIIHTYRLRGIEPNVEVEQEQFEYEPPDDYTVLRPQQE
jgi:outer membrane lipoprotein-sorting protein